MKRSVPIVFVLVFLTASCMVIVQPVKASGDFWVERAPMPSASAYVGAVTVNGKIYAVTPTSTYLYDPPTDTWTTKTSMPTVREGFAIVTYQNMIYVIGGCSGFNQTSGYPINCTGANEAYSPAADTWETKSIMPTARAELQANVVTDKIYVISGTDPSGEVSNASEVYHPSSDSWGTTAPIPTAVGLYASAVVDNKIYVEGGGQSGPSIGDLNQIYDPEANTWTLGAPLPAPLVVWAAAAATTGMFEPAKLYVIGGTADGIKGVNTTQIYDPQTNKWTVGASMPTARAALFVAVVNDTLYAVSGTDNVVNPQTTSIAVNEQYFPLGYSGPMPSPSPSPNPSSSLTSSPSIPEFPAWIILPLLVAASAFLKVLKRRVRRKLASSSIKNWLRLDA